MRRRLVVILALNALLMALAQVAAATVVNVH